MSTERQTSIPHDQIARFCQRWRVVEFALFGSVLRDDFSDDSDVDVLVTFAPDVIYSFKQVAEMQEELEAAFERPVDLLDRDAVRLSPNYIRRRAIFDSAQVVYA